MIGFCCEQEEATSYEKAVFESVSYLISQDKDDDVAVELHSKVSKCLNVSGVDTNLLVYQYSYPYIRNVKRYCWW